MRKQKRNPESGYALLLIFAMAAIVSVTLLLQIPRVAFEAQRDKEQLLIDRGEQYSRAIQMFVRVNHRFPGTMEELENTNNQRFLRKRYKDPMTGKEEWRILHAGPGGVIIDSVDSKKTTDTGLTNPNKILTLNGFNTLGGNDPAATNGVNLATRQRPSDAPGAPGDPNAQPSAPGVFPNTTGPVTVLPDGRIVPLQDTSQPPQGAIGAVGASGNPAANLPPLPNGVAIQQNGGNIPATTTVSPLSGPAGGPGNASSLINQILTTPRPGGMGGIVGAPSVPLNGQPPPAPSTTSAPQQQVIGGGIAGVASKKEQEGIKVYKDHTAYNEWEFTYDMSKDPTQARGAMGGSGNNGRGGNQPVNPSMPPGMSPPPPGRGAR